MEKTQSKRQERIPEFYRILREKCKYFNTNTILNFFTLTTPKQAGCKWTGQFNAATDRRSVKDLLVLNVYGAFENFDKNKDIDYVFIQHAFINYPIMFSLTNTLLICQTITTLRLEYCKLSKISIETLNAALYYLPLIADLSLNGNPNPEQNHGIIAVHEQIKYLSLCRCKLGEIGINLVCSNIIKQNKPQMLVLQLSGNIVGDKSAYHLEMMLRQNRSIVCLDISDNLISNIGCRYILRAMQRFALTREEIADKRRINLEYYKTKEKLIEKFNLTRIGFVPVVSVKLTRKKKSPRAKASISKKRQESEKNDKELEIYLEENLEKPFHPFFCNFLEVNDDQLICPGNYSLTTINLTYNDLSNDAYLLMLQVLTYQEKFDIKPGLVYIFVNGNADSESEDLDEVNRLLLERQKKLGMDVFFSRSIMSMLA